MIDRLVSFLKKRFPDGIQTFFVPSIAGDPFDVIFEEGNVEVRWNGYYEYIEILGLEVDEIKEITEKLGDKF